MATEILMPQMGESIAEGTITKWLAQVGEQVERDEPLLEISTDKVDAEVPSPASGTLLEIRFQEGETVDVDTVIGVIGAANESVAQPPPDSEPTAVAATVAAAPASAGSALLGEEERVRQFSSPVVRKIASEHGIDLEGVAGTGIHGRVTKRDVLQYLEEREESPAAAAPTETAVSAPARDSAEEPVRTTSGELVRKAEAAPPQPAAEELSFSVPAYNENESVAIEPMSRIRRLTAAHMLYSQQTSAHVATVFDVDLSGVVATRNRVKGAFQDKVGTKLTYMPFFFQAIVDGLRTYPKFNASIEGTDIVYKKEINLGMAVAVDWGLIVPVIHRADQLNLVGLARQANDLAERARAKKLRPEEAQGGTFTVTNPGVFGSLFGVPLINQPQVAILCLGAIEKRAVVVTDRDGNDSIAIRPMAYLALSYDHRLIDGADAEAFMVRIKKTLADSSWDELSPFRA